MLSHRRALLAVALPCLLLAAAAHAQSPLGIGTAEPSYQPLGGPLAPLFAYVNVQQQAFYRALTKALIAMRSDPLAITGLVGLSFAYGVFHAAGPGHGKAVISSYLLANEMALRRGILIAFVSAMLQGIMAVALVAVAWAALRGTGITLTLATRWMEIASFVAVILFGCWLLLRKLMALSRRQEALAVAAGPVGLALDWQDEGFARQATGGTTTGPAGHRFISGMACETCGETHMPDPVLLSSEQFSLREAWSAVIAVGLRPCSGALLVMTFSILNGLYLAGILSVFAISLGTAITVALLATLAVLAKSTATRLAGPGSRRAAAVGTAIEILGALFVILTGVLLLGGSLAG